jgi:hypothetical protein
MRPRRLATLAIGCAASALSLGLVLAQDAPTPAPAAAPQAPADAGAAPLVPPAPIVTLPGGPPPEEEGAPPPELSAEANAPAEPVEPPDQGKPAEPMKRPRYASAILQAVDKVTAQTLRFEAKVGEPVRFGGLVISVHACESAAPDEGFTDYFAHLDVQAQPEGLARQPARVVYRGWMFAGSPSLHPLQHPLYDVWLIACRAAAPDAAGGKT